MIDDVHIGVFVERNMFFRKGSSHVNRKVIKDLDYYLILRQAPNTMNLDKFLNMKPRPATQKMDIENPEKLSSLPWVEKYRPNKLEDLTYQEEVTNSLKNVLKTGNMPHLLFYGPAGTGKTSAIIALSKELFGPKFYKERVLELNASDERGISVIREKVKKFAMQMCVKNTDKTYLCPNFKVIILDEADLMTTDAQSALRRVIEDNSATTRFCIICNYITKIIEPLSSRCIKFRFKPIPFEAQLVKLRTIAISEGVKLDEQQIKGLLERGDLRQSINSLQSFNKLTIIPNELLPVGDHFGQDILTTITKKCNSIKEVYELGKQINSSGYAYDEVLNSLQRGVLKMALQQRKKGIMLETISKAEESLMVGATELPLVEVLTSLFFVIHHASL